MTQFWTITDASGALEEACFATSGAAVHPRDEGFAWIDGEHAAVALDAPIDPEIMAWDGEAWTPAVGTLRSHAWAAIKERKFVAEQGGCLTPLGMVDTDAESQRKIAGAVQMAMIAQGAGAPFAITWTMKDNATVAHDGPAMIMLGLAVGQHIAACHATALAKRAALEAAETAAEIGAVAIDSGWPGQ